MGAAVAGAVRTHLGQPRQPQIRHLRKTYAVLEHAAASVSTVHVVDLGVMAGVVKLHPAAQAVTRGSAQSCAGQAGSSGGMQICGHALPCQIVCVFQVLHVAGLAVDEVGGGEEMGGGGGGGWVECGGPGRVTVLRSLAVTL